MTRVVHWGASARGSLVTRSEKMPPARSINTMMKKLLSIALIVSCSIVAVMGQEGAYKKERPNVAVVLSGGSAKGFAHVGALQVLEKAGIPIDIVAGTSMGAVIGGLYSVGYTADMIDSLINLQDWNYLMRDHVSRQNLPAAQRGDRKSHLVSLPYQLKIKERSGRVSLPPGVYAEIGRASC